MRYLAVLLLLAACGPGWADADTRSASDAVHAEMMVERLCADGGACVPTQVRALERATLCANEAMLYRHGAAVPEAGVACQAP